jgi:hypothetical protein
MRIIAAIAVSIALSLLVIQNSEKLQDTISTAIIQFIEKDWSARLSITEKPRINFFTFSVYLGKGTVTPIDAKKYHWAFDECLVYVSPFALLTRHQAELHISLNNVTASTNMRGLDIDLVDHIKQILVKTDDAPPISLESLRITNIDATVNYGQQKITCKVPGTFALANDSDLMRYKSPTWHGSLELEKALLCVNDIPYAQEFCGTTDFYLDEEQDGWQFSTNSAGKLPIVDSHNEYVIAGRWNQDGGALMLTGGHNATRLAITFSYPLTIGLKGYFPVNHINHAIRAINKNHTPHNSVGGQCTLNTVLVVHDADDMLTSSGTVVFDNVTIGSLELKHTGIVLSSSKATVADTPVFGDDATYGLRGTFDWDLAKNLSHLRLANTNELILTESTTNGPIYTIAPGQLLFNTTCDSDAVCRGSYRFNLNNKIYKKAFNHRGILAFKNSIFAIKGQDQHGNYAIKTAISPHPHLINVYYEKNGLPLVQCSASKQKPFCLEGSVSWLFLKRFLDQQYRRMIFSADGSLFISLNQQNPEAIATRIAVAQGSFYMPEYHNILKNFSLDFIIKPEARQVELNNALITMSKGEISCPHAVAKFDGQYNLSYLMAPWKLDNLFVNWKKDFYGFAYGTLTLSKKENEAAMLTGNIVLKKSIIKDSFLQEQTNSSSYNNMPIQLAYPIGFDLKLMTETPIRTKVGSFNTAARVDLSIVSAPQKDFFGSPIVTGSIDLEKGSLSILNKKLAIQYGKLQFLHNNLQDPLIDLMARSRIGKYVVSLQATGSLQKPTILLESNPGLSEEQIIGLLLTGSELSSLQSDLPAMLMQNLDALIFSRKKSSPQQSVMDKITKTLKYVQITPNFDAATGERGILKGSVTMNVTDQLRAKIDKDLDLQKNFSAQIEYLLSDNINLKLVQEQRGESGVEVEFRIKP